MQGFNMGRYRPPTSDPRTQSFNSHTKTHPLGKRASKLSSQGILVVRFELPFNIWCSHCNSHIAQGTRYNAEKRKVAMYLSTPIWSFACTCRSCSGRFVVQTDPQNSAYIITEGATKKQEEWERDESEETNHHSLAGLKVEVEGARERRGLKEAVLSLDGVGGDGRDPFATLEKRTAGKTKEEQRTQRILDLEALANRRSADPYTLNSRLRGTFRAEKKEEQVKRRQEERLKLEMGWSSHRKLILPGDAQDEDEVIKEKEDWKEAQQLRQKDRVAKGEQMDSLSLPVSTSDSSTIKAGKTRSSVTGRPKTTSHPSTSSVATMKSKLNPTASKLARELIGRTRRAENPFGQ